MTQPAHRRLPPMAGVMATLVMLARGHSRMLGRLAGARLRRMTASRRHWCRTRTATLFLGTSSFGSCAGR
eukprot:10448976-Alexandrium_andersonii.AAC.1